MVFSFLEIYFWSVRPFDSALLRSIATKRSIFIFRPIDFSVAEPKPMLALRKQQQRQRHQHQSNVLCVLWIQLSKLNNVWLSFEHTERNERKTQNQNPKNAIWIKIHSMIGRLNHFPTRAHTHAQPARSKEQPIHQMQRRQATCDRRQANKEIEIRFFRSTFCTNGLNWVLSMKEISDERWQRSKVVDVASVTMSSTVVAFASSIRTVTSIDLPSIWMRLKKS